MTYYRTRLEGELELPEDARRAVARGVRVDRRGHGRDVVAALGRRAAAARGARRFVELIEDRAREAVERDVLVCRSPGRPRTHTFYTHRAHAREQS